MKTMVRLSVLLLALAPVFGQPASSTLERVLSAAFPSALTASPGGDRVAWVSNAKGVRNIMVAEAPAFAARALTAYTADDGQEISEVVWTPDGSAVVYVRGGSANPAHDAAGTSESIWIVRLDGGAPRRLADGNHPSIAPRGDRMVHVSGSQNWIAPLDGSKPPARAYSTKGAAGRPMWSPDGNKVAFLSSRGDHSYVGVWDAAANTIEYLDPSTDFDSYFVWSPDSRSVAFIRQPSSGLREPRQARRAGEPWSIRVADVASGRGRELWRAREGAGSVFRTLAGDAQLLWTATGAIVFPWEADGWNHLYSMPVAGGSAKLLTPGDFEVESATLASDRNAVVYCSNQGDLDRRHLWRVALNGAPAALTSGDGIETAPEPLADGVAFLRSDARKPLRVAVRRGNETRDLDPSAIPSDFPLADMVQPQAVTFESEDGLTLHGQLFLPRARAGRAPALVFFHGGPRRQMLLGWNPMAYYHNAYAINQYFASQGYVVLAVNFRSGVGYGLNFREAPGYGASGASDYADVRAAALYLRARADVDSARIGAWGGSYGGFLTALALARSSDLFKAGVDFHGVHDWALELGIPTGAPDYKIAYDASPVAFVDTWRSPVLLIHGDDDPDVLFKNTVVLADALRKRKVDVEELILPDEVHEFLLHRTWLRTCSAMAEFFARTLK